MRLNTSVAGAAVGASLVYLFDRDYGHVRRHRLGNSLGSVFTARPARLVFRPGSPSLLQQAERRLNRFKGTVPAGQSDWDFPLTTVTINVDDTVTLRGMFRAPEAGELSTRATPAHRGFTRCLQRARDPHGQAVLPQVDNNG